MPGSFSRPHRRRATRRRGHVGSPLTLAIISLALGVPISAIAVAAGTHAAGVMGLVVVWIAVAIINVAYCLE
jgi:hypothetical protein